LLDVNRVYADAEIAVFSQPDEYLAFNHELLVTSMDSLHVCTNWEYDEHITLKINSDSGNGMVQAHENLLADAAIFLGHYDGGISSGEWYSSMMYFTPDGFATFHPSGDGDLDPQWTVNMYGDFAVSSGEYGEAMRIDPYTGDVHINGHLYVNGNQVA
jgi:hypothetical protein